MATGCLLGTFTAATAAVAPVEAAAATPPVPAGLPASIEPLAAYVAASSCDPVAKPGAVELGDLLKATYPGSSYGIDRTCGTDPLPTSEHYDGRPAMSSETSIYYSGTARVACREISACCRQSSCSAYNRPDDCTGN